MRATLWVVAATRRDSGGGVNPTEFTLLMFLSDIHIKMLDTLTGEDNIYSD